jgi:PAS domain S-box-containing protein
MMAMAASGKEQAAAPERVKLLLVDDDRDNLLALEAILEPLHQELMLAQSGPDALRLCLDHKFAVILLDVRMPDMDGFETAELIRLRKQSRHTPILFLTAYRSDEQLFRGYDLGAVDFLFKPIVPEILQSKVSVFVELSRSEQLLQRQAEELTRAEQRFRAVLEAAPDAMVITNREGVIELANSSGDALFGYSREDLIGRDIRLLIPDWEPPPASNHAASSETRLVGVRGDGSSFPARITRSPFQTSGSWLITTAIRDATDQVQAEARIHKINAELERRVAERTAALSYSNDALRQFAWAASHDLQEPIRTVLSYSQWLAVAGPETPGESRERMLHIIQDHAGRLHQLLGALRQYVQVSESGAAESGKANWTPVDCNAVLRQVTANLQGLIEETGAKVEWDRLPTISGLEVLFVQLFQNLIGNGIKYRSNAPPVIRVHTETVDGNWIFSVEDNGMGIDPKYRDYIFGVFRRLHRAGGTGMGLAICRAVVERMGGRIWLHSSASGKGSVFRFSVPARP